MPSTNSGCGGDIISSPHKVVSDVPIDAHYGILPSLCSHVSTAQDLSWHQEHFVCSRCNTDLSQGGYTVHNNRYTVCVHVHSVHA